MDVQSAVEVARRGIDMGFRVIGSKLNTIIDVHIPSLRINCDDLRNGDSMSLASECFKDGWDALGKLGVPTLRLEKAYPWTLGLIYQLPNSKVSDGKILVYDEHHYVDASGYVDHSVLELLAKQKNWALADWKTRIVTPVEQYQKEWITTLAAIYEEADLTTKIENALAGKRALLPLFKRLSFRRWEAIVESDAKNLVRLTDELRKFQVEIDRPHRERKARLRRILDNVVR
jgi:hypothetical protein